jgi:hypothetical protein
MEKENTFKNFFTMKYKNANMFTDLKINYRIYRRLKEFFFTYNQDSETKSLDYIKIKNLYKIITYEDLLLLRYKNELINMPYDEKLKFLKNKYNLDSNLIKPVNWKLYITILQEIIIQNNYNQEQTDKMLNELLYIIQNRKLDFQYYRSLYRKTFRKVFMKTLKDIFSVHSDIDYVINKEFKY